MIKLFDYFPSYKPIKQEIISNIISAIESGQLILGPQTQAFESNFSEFVDSRHTVAVTSGTQALLIALLALETAHGDEVITVANTCSPTASAILMSGAKPVFAEVLNDTLMMNLEDVREKITDRTKCIIAVHLWGNAVDLSELMKLSRETGIPVIEDCAQAFGTEYNGKQVGSFGDIGCFSFYPTKNLGAYGDAGCCTTNSDSLADRMKKIRMYGYDASNISLFKGTNARINEIQAAILNTKLTYVDAWLDKRRGNASEIISGTSNNKITFPVISENTRHSYHQLVIRTSNRPDLMEHLSMNDIGSAIHYETPLHRMPAYVDGNVSLPITESACDEILSIPVHENLGEGSVEEIVRCLNSY